MQDILFTSRIAFLKSEINRVSDICIFGEYENWVGLDQYFSMPNDFFSVHSELQVVGKLNFSNKRARPTISNHMEENRIT